MKISYAIEKLRRLDLMPTIELRPITILVGRNSAGKSTFLRSLPLLRQSIETRSSAPVLWYGDYVDFGDFETAVSGENQREEAAFCFKLENVSEVYRGGPSIYRGYRRVPGRIHVDSVDVRYIVGSIGEKTVMRRIEASIPSEGIDVAISWAGKSSATLEINGSEVPNLSKQFELKADQSRLFSVPFFVTRSKDSTTGAKRYANADGIFAEQLADVFAKKAKRKLSHETIYREVRRVLGANLINADTLSMFSSQAGTVSFEKIYEELRLNPYSKFSQEVLNIRKADRTFKVLDVIEDILTDFFENVGYLGPARAASERFYRRQELEVSEISPDGQNFPMFLASLPPAKLRGFSNWVEGIFGYGVELAPSMGHISINLRAGSKSVNVTDTGYGVSQILPVLGAIWWAGSRPSSINHYRRSNNMTRTLCIEQPELHLHPAHQSKLADVLVGAVGKELPKREEQTLNLLVETHSEALINRLGELVAEGKVAADKVQIVVFSAEDDINSPTRVSQATFNNDGILENWPFGFFNY